MTEKITKHIPGYTGFTQLKENLYEVPDEKQHKYHIPGKHFKTCYSYNKDIVDLFQESRLETCMGKHMELSQIRCIRERSIQVLRS
jgi:hypothetical protein